MNLYLDNGYVDIRSIRASGYPFIFMWGGRGIGKTYGVIDDVINNGEKMIFARRTQTMADIVFTDALNPFKRWNNDHGRTFAFDSVAKGVQGIYEFEKRGNSFMKLPSGLPIGYTAALSTFSHIRGIDASDVSLFFLDEFIKEPHEAGGFLAGAFFDAYETIARNRELEGAPPLQFIGASNAYNILNDFFIELEIVHDAYIMQKKNQAVKEFKDRGLLLIRFADSPISAAKSNTALYKLAKNTKYGEMALNNNFATYDYPIRSRRLNEYTPFLSVGEITVYIHKSRSELYVSPHRSGDCPKLTTGKEDMRIFAEKYRQLLRQMILTDSVVYEDYISAALLNRWCFEKNPA